MKFIVTIDTECDCSPTWHVSDPVAFKGVREGVRGILQPLFDFLEIKPVYFLSHEVMEDVESWDYFSTIALRCELATHLHAGFMEPQKRKDEMAGCVRYEMQRQYQYEIEYAKMKKLTGLFEKKFSKKPFSFRAGRYGVGHSTGRILMELGYKVDSSVTPHIHWKDPYVKNTPNFIGLPEEPYRVSETGDIWKRGSASLLEVPITIRPLPRKWSRFWRKEVAWFRPWSSSTEVLKGMLDIAMRREQEESKEQVMVMMFHNMEVIPAASPYPQTMQDVLHYVASLKETLEYAREIGGENSTLEHCYWEVAI